MKLNTPKVDSLRLIIPFEDVTINKNHSTFLRNIITINSDGEVLSEKENKAYRLHSNPCSSHYEVANMIDKGSSIKVLKLGFSSKTLKQDYFQGITRDNISEIHKFIISEGVISLSLETLLKAKVVDTDICIDILLSNTNVKEVVSIAKSISLPHKETNVNAFQGKNNAGIEWGHRNKVATSYVKKQYLKYYAKSLELKHHSTKFYDAYIKNKPAGEWLSDSKSLRIETTLKNSAHWRTYNIEVITLEDLLSLNLRDYHCMFNRPINHYMSPAVAIKHRTKLTPNQKLQLSHIDLLQKHYDIDEVGAIQMMLDFAGESKQQRYQYKKALLKLVSENRIIDVKTQNEKQLNIIEELEKMEVIPAGK